MPRSIAFSSKIVRSLGKRLSSIYKAHKIYVSLSHGLDANTPLIREKYENLVPWVCARVSEEVELVPAEYHPDRQSVSTDTIWYTLTLRYPHCWRSDFEKWLGPFEFRRQKRRSPC
jgi:hypothetical protein